jgi:RNA polymerase sigma-70 factor (ECF subfamily)
MAGSDERLARQALCGDREAFDALVRRYHPRVLGLCRKLLGNPDTARDAAQEALVRAYCKLHLYNPDHRFSAWLMTLTARLCVNIGRRRAQEAEPWEALSDGDGRLADRAAGPPEQAEKAEVGERVAQAVRSLPDLYKPVAILRHLEGLSYQEIAEATGLPIGTVKIHLFRAKKHLREKLADLVASEADEDAGAL